MPLEIGCHAIIVKKRVIDVEQENQLMAHVDASFAK
jgi:hypothetical protein